jgi:hypothetical protein
MKKNKTIVVKNAEYVNSILSPIVLVTGNRGPFIAMCIE